MALSGTHDLRGHVILRSGCERLVNLCRLCARSVSRHRNQGWRGAVVCGLDCGRDLYDLARWTNITNSVVAVTQSGSAAGSVFTSTPSAANTCNGRQDRLHLLRFGTAGGPVTCFTSGAEGVTWHSLAGPAVSKVNPWPTRALPARSRLPSVRAFQTVRIVVTSNAYVAVGVSPTATTSDTHVPANWPGIHQRHAGEGVAIKASAGGTLNVTEIP